MAKRSATIPALTLVLAPLALGGTAGDGPPPDKAPAAAKVVVKEDLVYGRVEGAGLLADVAYPEGDGPFPVILSVHGGRWKAGSRTDKSAINVRQWAGFGFFAMTIDYRLVGCTPAPACYQDVLCAVRWLHANAPRYPIDRERIFLIGQSAGGHMVALAATLGDGPFPRTGGWNDQKGDFRAAIAVAANYDLEALDWGAIWKPADQDQAAARRLASPVRHVSPATKPMLIIHSDDDRSVPVRQAVEMAQALEKARVRSRFRHYTDKGHMGITDDVIREARAFIEELTAGRGNKR
jgi:acetyl esterase/lipase